MSAAWEGEFDFQNLYHLSTAQVSVQKFIEFWSSDQSRLSNIPLHFRFAVATFTAFYAYKHLTNEVSMINYLQQWVNISQNAENTTAYHNRMEHYTYIRTFLQQQHGMSPDSSDEMLLLCMLRTSGKQDACRAWHALLAVLKSSRPSEPLIMEQVAPAVQQFYTSNLDASQLEEDNEILRSKKGLDPPSTKIQQMWLESIVRNLIFIQRTSAEVYNGVPGPCLIVPYLKHVLTLFRWLPTDLKAKYNEQFHKQKMRPNNAMGAWLTLDSFLGSLEVVYSRRSLAKYDVKPVVYQHYVKCYTAIHNNLCHIIEGPGLVDITKNDLPELLQLSEQMLAHTKGHSSKALVDLDLPNISAMTGFVNSCLNIEAIIRHASVKVHHRNPSILTAAVFRKLFIVGELMNDSIFTACYDTKANELPVDPLQCCSQLRDKMAKPQSYMISSILPRYSQNSHLISKLAKEAEHLEDWAWLQCMYMSGAMQYRGYDFEACTWTAEGCSSPEFWKQCNAIYDQQSQKNARIDLRPPFRPLDKGLQETASSFLGRDYERMKAGEFRLDPAKHIDHKSQQLKEWMCITGDKSVFKITVEMAKKQWSDAPELDFMLASISAKASKSREKERAKDAKPNQCKSPVETMKETASWAIQTLLEILEIPNASTESAIDILASSLQGDHTLVYATKFLLGLCCVIFAEFDKVNYFTVDQTRRYREGNFRSYRNWLQHKDRVDDLLLTDLDLVLSKMDLELPIWTTNILQFGSSIFHSQEDEVSPLNSRVQQLSLSVD